jgi:hypothetical protein
MTTDNRVLKLAFLKCLEGRGIAQAVSRRLSTAANRVRAKVSHVEFVMEKVTLGQVFSEYFGFPCQFLSHRLLHTHHLSSGVGTTGQLVGNVPSRLTLTQHQETKKEVP